MTTDKTKRKGEELELPDDAEIEINACYDLDNPLEVKDPDPNMRYFYAANDSDKSRPDGVEMVKRLGYRVSEKENVSTDCILMECPKHVFDARQSKMQNAIKNRAAGIKKQNELRSAIPSSSLVEFK